MDHSTHTHINTTNLVICCNGYIDGGGGGGGDPPDIDGSFNTHINTHALMSYDIFTHFQAQIYVLFFLNSKGTVLKSWKSFVKFEKPTE